MALYGGIKTLVPVSSCRVAEGTKLLENIFRSVNIALVNELKIVYNSIGGSIFEKSLKPRKPSRSGLCRSIQVPALVAIVSRSIHSISRERRGSMAAHALH